MPVPVATEPKNSPTSTMDMERCCFCRAKTAFWTELPERKPGDQVACCEACAKQAWPLDVPSKRVWMRRENIAVPTTFGDRAMGRGVRPPHDDEIATYPARMVRV